MGLFPTCMLYLGLACVVVPVLSTSADAQTNNNRLRGLSKIQLVIEELDPTSSVCGVTESEIQTSVKYPISVTKLQFVGDGAENLYVNVSTLYFASDSYCVSNVDVEVYSYQQIYLKFSGRATGATVRLWHHGAMISSNKSQHSQQLKQEIEDMIKQFITDWNLGNKDLQLAVTI